MIKINPKTSPIKFTQESLFTQEETLETGRKHISHSIGIPLERGKNENRISLTPLAVELLVQNGQKVYIEKNAGKDAKFSDTDFSENGAIIVENVEEIFQCDIVLKVSPFREHEIDMLKGNQLIISAFHSLMQNKEYILRLLDKKVTAIAFEYLKDENDCFPVVRSMSEIAGNTSMLIASEYLSNIHGGKGEMLGGITGVSPSEVVILGAGTAGEFAARTALGLGALVKVFDFSAFKIRRLKDNLHVPIFASLIQSRTIFSALKSADVVIGAIRIIDESPRFLVTEEMVKNMKKGSVIIDISIDQGGCFETSEYTSHSNPVFIKHGVVHYCVPNISSRVARTASYALSNIFGPLLLRIGNTGSINTFLKEDAGTRHGVYIYNGILTKSHVGERVGLPYKDIELLMAAF